MNTKLITIASAGIVALSVASCAASRVDANFGDAVQSNVEAQVYDPATLTNPSLEAVEGTDGQRMETVMEEHRGQAGDRDAVSSPIIINVGQ